MKASRNLIGKSSQFKLSNCYDYLAHIGGEQTFKVGNSAGLFEASCFQFLYSHVTST